MYNNYNKADILHVTCKNWRQNMDRKTQVAFLTFFRQNLQQRFENFSHNDAKRKYDEG